MIYFAQPPDGGPVKIGFSECPERRLLDVASESRSTLELVATLPGGKDDERWLHRQFASIRIGREWFEPVPVLVEFILATAGDNLLRPPIPAEDGEGPDAAQIRSWATSGSGKVGRPRKNPEDKKTEQLRVKSRAEWKAWLQRYAAWRGRELSELLRGAIEAQAKAEGFSEEPPGR